MFLSSCGRSVEARPDLGSGVTMAGHPPCKQCSGEMAASQESMLTRGPEEGGGGGGGEDDDLIPCNP